MLQIMIIIIIQIPQLFHKSLSTYCEMVFTFRERRLKIVDSAPGSSFQFHPRLALEAIIGTLIKLSFFVKILLMEFCQMPSPIL